MRSQGHDISHPSPPVRNQAVLIARVQRLIIATGIASVAIQLLVIREFLSQLNGNELVVSLILFNWLLAGGVGARLADLFKDRASLEGLFFISLGLALVPPAMILGIRFCASLLSVHGGAVGFYQSLGFTLAVTGPYCLVLGLALPYSLLVLRKLSPGYSSARVYILDNLGDVAGGALFSFGLVYLLTPLQGVAAAQLPLLAATLNLCKGFQWKNRGLLLGGAAVMAALGAGIILEQPSLSPDQGDLLYYRESPHGRIEIIRHESQTTLVQNGRPVFSNQNTIAAEEAVHYPLSQLARTGRILMISAESRMMEEALKHAPDAIDYVEIDPVLMAAQFRFHLIDKDPRVNPIPMDGRAWLVKADTRYDAILVNLPEPDTFQINRFYTADFFALARENLSPGGIFCFSVKGFDAYPADAELQKISILFFTARQVFPFVQMIPANRLYFLCARKAIQTDIPRLLANKDVATDYVGDYYYEDAPQWKMRQLEGLVDPNAPVNRDFSPHLVRALLSEWFALFSTSPAGFVLALAVLHLIQLPRVTREEWALYTTGWAAMGSEIVVIIAFQIFFGYMYLKIGLIITVSLAGLLPGAMAGDRLKHLGARAMVMTDAALAAMMLLFLTLIVYVRHPPESLFLGFGFAASVLCGAQFPVAVHLQGAGRNAAINAFSADLAGAAFGVLATSVFLIPQFGAPWSLIALAALKITSLVLFWRKSP